jgi:cytochrome c-type biogenesis protein CcmF
VHAFATDPRRGVFILGFLVVVIGGSLTLYAWRAPKVGLGGAFEPISRESMLLVNNVLLTVASGSVLLGTLYPLFLDALGMGKISVGPPYFDAVFFPLMVPVIALMAFGQFARWKQADLGEMAKRLRVTFILSLCVAGATPFIMGAWSSMAAFGFLLASWLAFSCITHLVQRVHDTQSEGGALAKMRTLPRAYYGMLLAHMGVAVFIVGVAMVKTYEENKDVRMQIGSTTEVGGYSFLFKTVGEYKGPNYVAAKAVVEVSKGGQLVTTMAPEKRMYLVQQMPMTEAAINYGLFRDLYVALGEAVDQDTWIVRVHHKPFVVWIWLGCLLMAFGGGLSASDRRYRIGVKRPADEAVPASAATQAI